MTDELNPFVYDDPLPPDALIDRDEEARKLLSLAEGGHNTRLSAPRRYGKTSITYACSPRPIGLGCTPCMSISIGV